MKTCICTVIKNEHLYLDEWIQYHLDLGIDHIFVYEDIDSNSHSSIAEKYDCRVELNRISSILNIQQEKLAYSLKSQHKLNLQTLYFTASLNFIKNKKEYDWCFLIDVDEFITCDNISILEKYSSYDALVMSWECYGACDHINKPLNSVLKSYNCKSKGTINNAKHFNTKICYNLNTYKKEFYKTNHQPSDFCNWCRTDFSKDREKEVFDEIYIRHYITKSWQEYVEKKYKRGFFVGISRTNDFFFDLNPELKCIKQELMEALNEEILVVLPYKQSSAQGKELEITLSLWRKNCTFKYHFVVIGEYDKSFETKFPWVEFIHCKSKEKIENQYQPHLDILNKFKIAQYLFDNKYKGFIAICDDEYAIKPFTFFDILQTHYHSNSFVGDKNAPVNYWRHDKWKTKQLLDKNNLPSVNYTTHYPFYYNFEKLQTLIDKFDLENESYVLEDLYFNYYQHEKPIIDSTIRLGVWNHEIYEKEFQKALDDPNIKFVCNSVEGWCKGLEESLIKLL